MAYEETPGDIVVFKNDKRTNDKQPEYRGTWINADGEKCNVSLWVREAKSSGKKFFSGKIDFEPWNQERKHDPEPERQSEPAEQFYDDSGPDEEVPF